MKITQLAGWTCALWLFAVSAGAQTTFVPGLVRREFFANATRLQVETNAPAGAVTNFYTSWNATDDRQNYTARFSGWITPTTAGTYDFFLAADDDTDLFISTDSSPTNKFLIAQENQWSALLNWNTPGTVLGIASQKNSSTWTNGLGVSPYSAGITLNNSTRYYLEAVQHGGGGGNRLAVTMVQHGFGISDGVDTVLTNGSADATIGVIIPTPTLLLFTGAGNPSNRTNFVGTAALFRGAPAYNSQIPPRYQWLSNNVPILGATNSTFDTNSYFTIMASTNLNGVQFRCVASVPGFGTPVLVRTSSVATLTVPITGGLSVTSRLKDELFSGITEAYPLDWLTNDIQRGNVGPPTSVATATSFNFPSQVNNYGERTSGFFTPSQTGYYVFFLAADDEAQLFVSTDDQPVNKRLVAQEDGFSGPLDWTGNSSGGGSLPGQKRSDQWTPDGGATTPYSGGIFLTAGNRYYIEANHFGALGNNNHVDATFATTNDVALGLPASGDPSAFTNALISYVTRPVTQFSITNQPVDVTRFEGLPYTFIVGIQTDSEITPTYQWKKNNVPIPGAVGPKYSSVALTLDNNAVFSCTISIPGVGTTNTTNVTLTVIAGTFAEGILRREFWTNAVVRGITRQLVGANAGGFPDPDYQLFIDSLDITESRDDHYVQRISGFFVPPVTTNYVFFIACDDDSDLYISTDQQPANKYLIAQENVWSSARQWLTANGGGNAALKRSDQFNGGAYAAGIPLSAGQRYYLEVVHNENTGGEAVSATYKYIGEDDPPNGSPTRLNAATIGTPVPAASALGIVTNPQNASVAMWQPVYFTAFSTNDSIVPSTYQWRRNGSNIVDRTASSLGFITSSNDNGAMFDCVVRAPGTSLVLTSSVASLTVGAGGTLVNAALARETWNIGVSTRLIEFGGLGPADSQDTVLTIDHGVLAPSESTRTRGFFVPPVTTNYVFFISSDDTAEMFLSTDDQPSRKRLIVEEQGFSTARSWLSATSGDSALKRSDTWTADGGVTHPYEGGIWMTNGQRYYLEAIHTQAGGDENFGVTFKMGIDPSNDPLAGDPSTLTNSVIAYMQAPVAAQRPVITISKVGNSVNISWTPAGGTLQSTPTLTNPAWNPVGTINPTNIVIAPTGNLFLRVTVP